MMKKAMGFMAMAVLAGALVTGCGKDAAETNAPGTEAATEAVTEAAATEAPTEAATTEAAE